jgi:sugar/nucleoside kinase (ribokinase family)
MTRDQQIKAIEKDWAENVRWTDVKRGYTAADVVRLRGSVQPEHTLARRGAEQLWNLVRGGAKKGYVNCMGAITAGQAMQQAKAGVEAIYLSGWQVAADGNTSETMYPDQSLYAYDSVPTMVRRINNTFKRADEIQWSRGIGPGDADYIDYFLPIVADAEAGFGGVLNAFELMKNMIVAGAAGVHFEDQLAAVKKCGHMGGKVLVPTREAVEKLIAARLASDVMGVPTLLLARTDAEAANLLGGSAAYAAIAASYYTTPVHLVGIIGKDFPQAHLDMLEGRGITLEGLERSAGDSFSWSGEYHENMNDRTTRQVDINVLENWSVKVPAAIAGAPIVVLANMAPENQIQMLDSCAAVAAASSRSLPHIPSLPSSVPFVVADTMDLWIHIANDRLHDVLKRIDLLVINESEAREFVSTSNLVVAGQRLLAKGPRFVVIKLGEFGAMLFAADAAGGELSAANFFRCAAFPLHEVIDPTGAGDSFLGALAGYLAATGRSSFTFDDIRQAVVEGSVVASFTCEAFSTRRLQQITRADIDQRLAFLQSITHWP